MKDKVTLKWILSDFSHVNLWQRLNSFKRYTSALNHRDCDLIIAPSHRSATEWRQYKIAHMRSFFTQREIRLNGKTAEENKKEVDCLFFPLILNEENITAIAAEETV